MSDQDGTIFDNEEPNTPPVEEPKADQPNDDPSEPDPVATLLSEIKREDGTQKYTSVEDALKSVKPSQEFIETLKSENAELKNKLELYKEKAERSITMEEILNTLSDKENESNKPNEQPSDKLDLQTLKTLFKQFSEEERTTEQQTHNLKSVDEAIMAKFKNKEKAAEFLTNKAKEIGVSTQYLKDISSHSPKAAIKLLGLEDVKEPVGTEDVPSSMSTERFRHPRNPKSEPRSPFNGGNALDAWRKAGESVRNQQ
jgi:hypothetical protein